MSVDIVEIEIPISPEAIEVSAPSTLIALAHAATHGAAGADPVTIAESQVTGLATDLAGKAASARQVATSGGLQGGGDLSADRTLSPVYGAAASTVCQGSDARLSDARAPLIDRIQAIVGDQSGSYRTIACQIVNAAGSPIQESRDVMISALSVYNQAAISAASPAIGTIIRAAPMLNTASQAYMLTDATGAFSFRVPCPTTTPVRCIATIVSNGCLPVTLGLTYVP